MPKTERKREREKLFVVYMYKENKIIEYPNVGRIHFNIKINVQIELLFRWQHQVEILWTLISDDRDPLLLFIFIALQNFFKWATPGLFFVYFCLFKHTLLFLQQTYLEIYPSSMQCCDLNPQPPGLESPSITTRPGFLEK